MCNEPHNFPQAARAWHVDVARYLLEKGADINQGDNFGRTPMHVAAAVDYPDMVAFLIRKKGKTIIIYVFYYYIWVKLRFLFLFLCVFICCIFGVLTKFTLFLFLKITFAIK